MIKSVYDNQTNCLKAIQTLYCPKGFECDLTFGNGGFYNKEINRPKLCFDIKPKQDFVEKKDATNTFLKSESLNNVIVDLPFLPYIRETHKALMAKRFSGYWQYSELIEAYKKTLKEASRILINKGILVFKCQDVILNHRYAPTHVHSIKWAKEVGLSIEDIFILVATHRMPVKAASHGIQTQKHARVFHSYFLIFKKQNERVYRTIRTSKS